MNFLFYIKGIVIFMYRTITRIIYTLFNILLKRDPEKVVIILSRSKQLEGNIQYIYNELLQHIPSKKVHFINTNNKMNFRLFKEVYVFSNASYLILDDYYLPIYLIKPKQIKIIQLWHAAGAFKKFGYSTIGTRFGPDLNYLRLVPIHSNYTHVYISSKQFVSYYAEAFNMDSSNIFPIGIPRVDFFNEDNIDNLKKKLKDTYSILDDNKINILIAPTYRATGLQEESRNELINALLNISPEIHNNIRILFKAHPYTKEREIKELQKTANITVLNNEFTINEWMIVSDAFLTDYSSAIFEYALLKKPLAHFVPDLKYYTANRGLYNNLEVISDGNIINTEKALLHWINQRHQNEYLDTSRMIKYNFDNTENVSKKIVQHFLDQ